MIRYLSRRSLRFSKSSALGMFRLDMAGSGCVVRSIRTGLLQQL